MSDDLNAWGFLRRLTWQHVLLVLAVLLLARLLSVLVRWVVLHAATKAPPRLRLSILRAMPIAHLLIGAGAVATSVPILVEPTLRNVVALAAAIGLGVAFALKDYGSSLVAGLVTVLENTYQPGDWIKVDGTYGEVSRTLPGRGPRRDRGRSPTGRRPTRTIRGRSSGRCGWP